MILITPSTAFAPHVVPPGPRITSIRAMSSSGRSRTSQNTPQKLGKYTLRPSTITSSLLLNSPSNPCMLMAQTFELICDIYTRHHAQQAGNIVRAGAANVLLRDYENGGGCLRYLLLLLRNGSHLDIHQIF